MPSLASAKSYRYCIGIDCLKKLQLPRVPAYLAHEGLSSKWNLDNIFGITFLSVNLVSWIILNTIVKFKLAISHQKVLEFYLHIGFFYRIFYHSLFKQKTYKGLVEICCFLFYSPLLELSVTTKKDSI